MAERALVCSCDPWEMTDENTGEIRKGLTVWYLNEYRDPSDICLGYKPTKISAVPELFDQINAAKLPALFDLDFGSRPGAQGKATLTLVGLTKIASVNLFQHSAKPAQSAGTSS